MDLLFQAAVSFANLSNPSVLLGSEDVVARVRDFTAMEDRIRAVPDAREELERLILVPLDPTGAMANHAMMAGLILARWGGATAAIALLGAARHADAWCATHGRLNLGWLAPSSAVVEVLEEEVARRKKLGFSEIPAMVLIDALIHQRSVDVMPTVLAYIHGDDAESNRAYVLTNLVTLMPEQGLPVADELAEQGKGPLCLTALGLLAVYKSEQAYAELRRVSEEYGEEVVAWRWLGRIPRPQSLPLLVRGMQHPASGMRCDVVTSLTLLGFREAREAVIEGLFDSTKEVADQSMSLLFEWLGDDLGDFAQRWQFDMEGRLTVSSRQELTSIATKALEEMQPGLRYHNKIPILPAHNLQYLYRGILPGHTWYHWVSTTGVYASYDIHRNALCNWPTLKWLSDWYLEHETRFEAGQCYYHGKPL